MVPCQNHLFVCCRHVDNQQNNSGVIQFSNNNIFQISMDLKVITNSPPFLLFYVIPVSGEHVIQMHSKINSYLEKNRKINPVRLQKNICTSENQSEKTEIVDYVAYLFDRERERESDLDSFLDPSLEEDRDLCLCLLSLSPP